VGGEAVFEGGREFGIGQADRGRGSGILVGGEEFAATVGLGERMGTGMEDAAGIGEGDLAIEPGQGTRSPEIVEGDGFVFGSGHEQGDGQRGGVVGERLGSERTQIRHGRDDEVADRRGDDSGFGRLERSESRDRKSHRPR
jgi:hypothetical protein